MRFTAGQLGLERDQTTMFVNKDGVPTTQYGLQWNDVPSAISALKLHDKMLLSLSSIYWFLVYQAPYFIALMPKFVEVRTLEPRLLIQSTDVMSDARLICSHRCRFTCSFHVSTLKSIENLSVGRDKIYVASSHSIWRFIPVPMSQQISQLMSIKEFELALQLAV